MTKYEIRAELAGKAMVAMVSNNSIMQYYYQKYKNTAEIPKETIARDAVILADAQYPRLCYEWR